MSQRSRGAFWVPIVAIAVVELAVAAAVVLHVPYTEIDWLAYMQEVRGFLVDGEHDYLRLKGDTGPLVYPAFFVYVYGLLYRLTGDGHDIRLAQWIFAGALVATAAVVAAIYSLVLLQVDAPANVSSSMQRRRRHAWIVFAMLLLSRRVHSIFVLRLFNDGLAMLFMYSSILSLVMLKDRLASVLFSLALGMKMNCLLFLPGLAWVLFLRGGGWRSLLTVHLPLIVALQAVLGWPFLSSHPWSYLSKAFEFNREFFYLWTVNWKCLPERVFLSKAFGLFLLGAHVALLLVLLFGRFGATRLRDLWRPPARLVARATQDKGFVVLVLFASNFAGIVCCRTLHYQFYSWYFHTLPFLLADAAPVLPWWMQVVVFGGIEVVFNVYPPTAAMSVLLHLCHLTLLYGLLRRPPAVAKQDVPRYVD